jgi:hypothetical protein
MISSSKTIANHQVGLRAKKGIAYHSYLAMLILISLEIIIIFINYCDISSRKVLGSFTRCQFIPDLFSGCFFRGCFLIAGTPEYLKFK